MCLVWYYNKLLKYEKYDNFYTLFIYIYIKVHIKKTISHI